MHFSKSLCVERNTNQIYHMDVVGAHVLFFQDLLYFEENNKNTEEDED